MRILKIDVVLIPRRERGPALNSGVRACFGSRRRKVILKKYFALENPTGMCPLLKKRPDVPEYSIRMDIRPVPENMANHFPLCLFVIFRKKIIAKT